MKINTKKQIKLSLEEVVTLVVKRLVDQGKLNNTAVYANWHFDTWNPEKGYIVISQED